MKFTQSQLKQIIKEELEEVALMNRATQFAKQNANRKVTVPEVEKILGRQMKNELTSRASYGHPEFIENLVKMMNELGPGSGVDLDFLRPGAQNLAKNPGYRRFHPVQWLQSLFSIIRSAANPEVFATKSPTFKIYWEDYEKFQEDPQRHYYNWYHAKEGESKERREREAAEKDAQKSAGEQKEADAALMSMYAQSQMKENIQMKFTQSQLKQIIKEELAKLAEQPTLEEAVEEAASWIGPLLAMIAPYAGSRLYHWFVKQGQPPEPISARPPPPERRLREGGEVPAVPQELIDLIPDNVEDIEAALAQELNLNATGLEEFTQMLVDLKGSPK